MESRDGIIGLGIKKGFRMPNEGNKSESKAKQPRVYIRTFGCQMNDRDSKIVKGLLLDQGFKIAGGDKGEADKADVVLLNTCSVRQHAEDRVWSEVGRLSQNYSEMNYCSEVIFFTGKA